MLSNVKSKTWLLNDQPKIERTLLSGKKQLIVEPIDLLENLSSCTNRIFTNKTSLINKSGVNLRVHSNCHHQIIYSKLNLEIEYPPPYAREIQYYDEAQFDLCK